MVLRASRVLTLYFTVVLISCSVLYLSTVGLGHSRVFIPHFNYLGDRPFESTLFTQLFGIISCILSFIVQIQFVCNAHNLEKNPTERGVHANVYGVYVGHVSALGLFIVSCFQETYARFMHYIGRVMYLGGSIVYLSLQTTISIEQRDFRKKRRALIDAMLLILAVVTVVSFVLADISYDRPWSERMLWSSCDEGWIPHVLSAVSEWMIIALIQVYFYTFYPDFERTMITKTSIIVLPEELP